MPFRIVILTLLLAGLAGVVGECAQDDSVDNGGAVAGPKIVACRIGFAGRYKVGHWTPIWVDVDRAGSTAALKLELTASDSDGIDLSSTADVSNDGATELYAKVGRLGSSIRVQLIGDGRTFDETTIRPGDALADDTTAADMRATSELFLTIGRPQFGIREIVPDRRDSPGQSDRISVTLSKIEALPTVWFGFDAVDVVVLSTSDDAMCQRLAQEPGRLEALSQWVELGGRLVLLSGGRNAAAVLAEGKPLAGLVPGKLVRLVPLRETSALERYVESNVAIVERGSQRDLMVPQLVDVTGRVEVYGAGGNQLPLVVRAPHGLGEVTFVGLDLDEPPVADWPGKNALFRALLKPFVERSEEKNGGQRVLATSGYDDLSGAMRQHLAKSFIGVQPFGFSGIVALSVLYLLCLGPLNYLLVHKLLRRPSAAWVTFPLALLLFGGGALLLAGTKDDTNTPAINQVELVDVDVAKSEARGTFWAALYSPQPRRYDLNFSPQFAGKAVDGAESLLSWHGLAGTGIGGMSAARNVANASAAKYEQPARDRLSQVPLQLAGTKSLELRWHAKLNAPQLSAKLRDADGILTGTIQNETGLRLANVRLLHGSWAFRLKDVEPGGAITIDERLTPISVQTLITGQTLGSGAGQGGGQIASLGAEQATTPDLLNAMMFYAAAGGSRFAGLPYRYEAYCDLSRLLAVGRAVLVAEVRTAGSRLGDAENDRQLTNADDRSTFIVYRFVLPVER